MGASDMLICGEDLGFVPSCLPPIMQVTDDSSMIQQLY
jgi:4-alpha-glucanotransferase